MSGERHQGFENYETFIVCLHLQQERATYEEFRERGKEIKKEARKNHNVKEKIWTKAQAAKFTLANEISLSVEKGNPWENGKPTLYSDLLQAAMEQVNWDEIAEAFLKD